MKTIYFSLFLNLFFLAGFVFAQTLEASKTPSWQGKRYSQMGYDEKLRFVKAESDKILSLFGRTSGDEINTEGLNQIRASLDSYLRNNRKPGFDSCRQDNYWQSDLASVLKRGSRSAIFIREAFAAQKLPAQVGIYLAMIETEFCPSLQSDVGPAGMFQLTASLGQEYGLKTVRGATAANPDERFEPRPSARAAAKWMRKMIDKDFGNDAVGFPLAVSSYNRGEGMTKRHIADSLTISNATRISFWVLLDTQEKLIEKLDAEKAKETAGDESETASPTAAYMRQFQAENFKYVPKFFAAWIIGENPQTFGINLAPLSQTKN